jgi:hypothetical protein
MIKLVRFAYSPLGTFGKLTYNDNEFFTVERPWENNAPMRSCIPEGVYDTVWYNSPKFGRTLAVVGNTVSLFPDSNSTRSAILFHAGNTMDDLKGCIALGAELGFVSGKWAVLSSAPSTNKFLQSVDQSNPPKLVISQFRAI